MMDVYKISRTGQTNHALKPLSRKNASLSHSPAVADCIADCIYIVAVCLNYCWISLTIWPVNRQTGTCCCFFPNCHFVFLSFIPHIAGSWLKFNYNIWLAYLSRRNLPIDNKQLRKLSMLVFITCVLRCLDTIV